MWVKFTGILHKVWLTSYTFDFVLLASHLKCLPQAITATYGRHMEM
jgi:hypothetical protein